MGTAGIPQKIRANANGDRCCRDTAGAVEVPMGMEFVFVGTLRVRFRNLADDKNSGSKR